MATLPNCTEYLTSIATPQLIKAPNLLGGEVIRKNDKLVRYTGGFCIVFPYLLSSGQKVAVRCWIAHVPDAEKRSRQIAQELKESRLPYFVNFDYIEQGIATATGVFPVVVMDWVNGHTLKEYIKAHLYEPSVLLRLAQEFKQMVTDLHRVNFSHGDLQHGNIMVDDSGRLFLVDYDSMYVPGLEQVTDEIKGLAGYQHPGRNKLKYLSPKSDYFSELIIYTSILALAQYPVLWDSLALEDTETLIFTQEDIEHPELSVILAALGGGGGELAECANAIQKELQVTDIEELQPLEEAIVSETKKLVQRLSDKWKSTKELQPIAPKVDISHLANEWNKPMQKPQETVVDISNVVNKWRK
jgi:serine/threonine protein kinase